MLCFVYGQGQLVKKDFYAGLVRNCGVLLGRITLSTGATTAKRDKNCA